MLQPIWLHRTISLIKKELNLLWQDKQTRILLILPVILQIILFPFAATLNVTNATIAIYRQDLGQASHELIERITHSNMISRSIILHSEQQIQPILDNQQALLVVKFPSDFSRQWLSQQPASIQLLLDGRRSNSAQIAANYIQQIVLQYQQAQLAGQSSPLANQLVVRSWYNPNLDYQWFVLPSLVALITTIGVLIVTALSVAREHEQGTFEQLLVSPLTTAQIFIGKAIPAIIVATLQATIVLLAAVLLFRIPFQGSLLLYYFCIVSYGLSLVGFGMFISALCKTQQQAFIGIIVFMVPAILLSGYVAPVDNMPRWLQYLTLANPVRHFTELTKEIYLKDVNLAVIWHSLWPLYVITLLMGGIAYRLFRKQV